MSTATCPECGKPLHPGARYCGNCGAFISGAALARPETHSPEPACPACGSSLRPGVRFCNHCGWSLSPGEAAPQTHTGAPLQQAQVKVSPEPTEKPAQRASGRRPARGRLLPLILLVVIFGCGLAVVAGFFFARRYGWPGGGIPLAAIPSQIVASMPAEPTASAPPAATPSLAPSPTRPAPTPTARPVDTATRPAPATVVPTSTGSAPAPGTAGVLLFEDTFDGSLSQYWLTWGEPRAAIGAGFGDHWLALKAIDPGLAGVTTRAVLSLPGAPGLSIEFDAQMDGRYPQARLVLDWDPAAFDRGPERQEPGLLHLEIQPDQLTLSGRATRETCRQEITATGEHTYLLSLTEDQGVALYLDGAGQPACQITVKGIESQPGKLSFSGLGWVSRVKVLLPE